MATHVCKTNLLWLLSAFQHASSFSRHMYCLAVANVIIREANIHTVHLSYLFARSVGTNIYISICPSVIGTDNVIVN